MNIDSKILLSSWWVLFTIAVFLWYRNFKYDRMIASYAFLLALIQIVQYAFINGAKSKTSANLIYIIMWLQPIFMSFCAFVFLKKQTEQYNTEANKNISKLTFLLFLVTIIVFIYKLYELYEYDNVNMSYIDGKISWSEGKIPFMEKWYLVYFTLISLPLFIIAAYYKFKDVTSLILLFFIILSGCIVYRVVHNPYYFMSTWSLVASGIALFGWMGGLISQSLVQTNKIVVGEWN